MPKKQKLPAEEIIAIVRQCLKGEIGRKGAGRQVGVGKTTILRWQCNNEIPAGSGINSGKTNERRKLHGAGMAYNAGRTHSNRAGVHRIREKLRSYSAEIPSELFTGTNMDITI